MAEARFPSDTTDLLAAESLKHIVLDFRQMADFVQEPLVFERAEGVRYWDVNGKEYLDGISGIFVVTVGHNNPRVVRAVQEQVGRLAFAPPLHGTCVTAVQLGNLLTSITPGDLNTVKLLSGGSEATEAAMKLARQYHRQTGNPTKYKVIARYYGYHGATMGALSATGTPRRRTMFEPVMPGFLHIFPPTCFRCPYAKEYPSCDLFCAEILRDVIQMEGPDTVSAVIMEPIGNTGGIITPPPEYYPIIRQICDEFNVLLIFDEIITGFGRTGNMFAAQTFDTLPDILCMGKGMSSGYAPLAGIAFRDHVAAAFWGAEGREFSHGHTYGGNPLACAAGIAAITEVIERDLCTAARELGAHLRGRIEALRSWGIIGDVRGKGLLLGIEFVRDLDTKEPFGPEVQFGRRVQRKCLDKGLILRCDPDWVAFAPPLVATREEIDLMVERFAESVEEVLADVRRET
jgi:adenosylmethionine-8-amino-7-oxononanoate aminotransferase